MTQAEADALIARLGDLPEDPVATAIHNERVWRWQHGGPIE
jgi:hypothetical protein